MTPRLLAAATALAAILAGPAARAEPVCAATEAEAAALAAGIAGSWSGKLVSAIAIVHGVPHPLPLDGAPPPARFSYDGARLALEQADGADPLAFAPEVGAGRDFALPGEAPLAGAELLGSVRAVSDCPGETLPQFHGEIAPEGMPRVAFHLFLLAPDRIEMVLMTWGPGAGMGPDDAMRGVVDLVRDAG